MVRQKLFPDIPEVLRAIEPRVGQLKDSESQNKLLLSVLTPAWVAGLDENGIKLKVMAFRNRLAGFMSNNGASWHDGEVHRAYRLLDLFLKGPSAVVDQRWLDQNDWNVAEDDESPVGSIGPTDEKAEHATPTSRKRVREDPEDEFIPETELERRAGAQSRKPAKITIRPKKGPESSAFQGAVAVAGEGGREQDSAPGDSVSIVRQCDKRTATEASAESVTQGIDGSVAKKRRVQEHPDTPQGANTFLAGPRPSMFSSTVNSDPSEQRQSWAREAGHCNAPKVLPTKKPANPAEIIHAGDASWVTSQMESIDENICNAAISYCQQHNIDPEANTQFIPDPSPELEHLYATLFGHSSQNWRTRILTFATLNEAAILTQEYTLTSLFGAAIHSKVFISSLPWNLPETIPTALGPDTMQYISTVLSDYGHNLPNFLNHVAGKQAASQTFRANDLSSHATNLSDIIAMTSLPHLQRLTKRAPPASPQSSSHSTKLKPWTTYLQNAVYRAIVVRQTLAASSFGPFEYIWCKDTIKLNLDKHQVCFELPGANRVINTVLSGVRSKPLGKKEVWFFKTLVVPMRYLEKRKEEGRQATAGVSKPVEDAGESIAGGVPMRSPESSKAVSKSTPVGESA